jgi:chemotaxis signal transduction protein
MADDIYADGSDENIASKRAQADDSAMQTLIDTEQEDILLIDVGGRKLLIKATEVSEIIRPLSLTPVPMGPDHIMGLANVRGQIVCIINPSKVMQLPAINSEVTPHTRFVLLRHAKMHLGMWVDSVHELYRINSNQIPEPAHVDASEPSCGTMDIDGRSYDMFNSAGLFS